MGLPGELPAVFHLRNRTVVLVVSPGVIVLSLYETLTGIRCGEPWLNWFAGLVVWLILLTSALRRRLVLTEQGLEYTDTFSTVRVPWPQVTRLLSRNVLGMWRIEGLDVWTASPERKDRFIDLSQFSRFWRHESLGRILRERAPQVFR
jgi:hypothetical protein